MKNLFIFGDSFSAHYSKENNFFNNPYPNAYYQKEIENGHIGVYEDLQYHLLKLFGDEEINIINTAYPGFSNFSIFENFSKYSSEMAPGDYVMYQSTAVERYRIADLTQKERAIEVLPNCINKKLLLASNFSVQDAERMCIERENYIYAREQLNWINLVRTFCKNSGLVYFIWTIDKERLGNTSTMNAINEDDKIINKFSDLPDYHPTFQGNKKIAENIFQNWEGKQI